MAILHRLTHALSRVGRDDGGDGDGKEVDATSSPVNDLYKDHEKQQLQDDVVDEQEGSVTPLGASAETDLHRGLKARHITMIGLGGAIGTGLIIGSGSGLAQCGPLSLLIGYVVVGLLCNVVLTSLGEMATWLPNGSGFVGYSTRFVDPALGFALGWVYLFKYLLSTSNQLTSLALVLQYWVSRDKVNPGVFIAVFYVTIIFINYFGVRVFGETEFWLSALKLCVLIGILILSLILVSGGGPKHDAIGFRYWGHPGAIKPYLIGGGAGRFLSIWNSLTSGVFAYLGTELIGVTVGEAQNPSKTIPRAIRLTFWRITIFYVLTIFFLGMLVPYNSKELLFANKQGKTAAASPFVVAIQLAGIPTLPGIINGCIMIFNFSAANSDLYIGTRTLHGLAVVKGAPKFLGRTDKRGMPWVALIACSLVILLAFMNVSTSSTVVFGYFVNLSTLFGLITWCTILYTHIQFVKARRLQGVEDSSLAYKSPYGVWGSWISLAFCALVAVTKNFSVFVHSHSYGNFDYKNFIVGYIGFPIFFVLLFTFKIVYKTQAVNPATADLFGGRAAIARQEAAFLEREKEREDFHTNHKGIRKFYMKFVSWLF